MRNRLGVLLLATVALAAAACGGAATSAAPGGDGAVTASPVPAECAGLAVLRTTVEKLTVLTPGTDSVNAFRMAANNVATQAATLSIPAGAGLRPALADLKDAVGKVRAAIAEAGQDAAGAALLTEAIAGLTTAWQALETQAATICPG
jgi:hypothetical protein